MKNLFPVKVLDSSLTLRMTWLGLRFFAAPRMTWKKARRLECCVGRFVNRPCAGVAVRLWFGAPQRLADAFGGNGLLSVRVISLGQHRAIPAYRLRRRNDCALLPQMLCQMALSATRCRMGIGTDLLILIHLKYNKVLPEKQDIFCFFPCFSEIYIKI